MPVKPLRVLYEEDAQVKEMVGNLKHTHEVEKSNGFKYGNEFKSHWSQAALDMCAYKNPGFREEMEVRLVHAAGLLREGKSKKIAAMPGTAWGKKFRPGDIQFRVSEEVVVPYIVLDYSNEGTLMPIKEVILGPKNHNLLSNIEVFLNTMGMKEVVIRKSEASYR